MDSIKQIALLNHKLLRETKTRKAAEALLEQKSTELYYANLLVEESLNVVKSQVHEDEMLHTFTNRSETILLDYNSQLLQNPPSDIVIQQLLDDLTEIQNTKAVRFSSTLAILEKKQLQSGDRCHFDKFPSTKNKIHWKDDNCQFCSDLYFGTTKVGMLHFIFNTAPDIKWQSSIEKQYCLITDMISASFQRQLLLNKTIKEKLRAEKSEQSTRDFVAMINHELRTPLNVLLGAAQLIESTSITSYQQKLLNTVDSAGEMLRVIINDLLDISKLNAGMLDLKLADFCLRTLIEAVQQIFLPKVTEKGLTFNCYIDTLIPQNLLGDSDRVKQILINLIGNSVKFTATGEISLVASWKDNALYFIISDTGCGIPKNKQSTLFEPFTQVDNSSQRKFEGTGLGLSISKNLIELMGGNVTFTSELNQGTEFTVYLPLKPIVAQVKSVIEYQNVTAEIDKLKILAVEDIKMNQVILGLMLNKFGIEHQFADNGQSALEVLKDHQFDLILMDCRMPILDGYQTTRKLRKQGYKRPIIAITAGTTSVETSECFASGMNDILHKPYKLEELNAIIKKWAPLVENRDSTQHPLE